MLYFVYRGQKGGNTMLKKIESSKMGSSNLGWLKSRFHFSFSNYYNPENINFGMLRVVNDDIIEAGNGFDMHPHSDMEILTYVIEGELTHEDSMGHKHVLKRGDFQYMSAGTGIEHSEHNEGTEPLRLLQLWIYPDKKGHTPAYGDCTTKLEDRYNKLYKIASSKAGDGEIKINQNVNIYIGELDAGHAIDFTVAKGRQAYVIQIEGKSEYNQVELGTRDALESIEQSFEINPLTKAHIMIIELKKE